MTRRAAASREPVDLAGVDRRRFVGTLVGLGGSVVFAEALWAAAEKEGKVGLAAIAEAEKLAGLEFSAAERELMLEDVHELVAAYEAIREVPLPNEVAPAFRFDPLLPGTVVEVPPGPSRRSRVEAPAMPPDAAGLALLPVTHLGELLRSGQLTSTELTRAYLDRLRRHGPVLECVVTLTEELALRQAARADEELAAGRDRGPLHGIPWGAKDLLAVRGYPTTWGAMPFKEQTIDTDATVVRRLEEAGAVLVAKLSLGALAWGDVWFGGTTHNPWNLEEGSSGSSAGSAAATAAGLAGFTIGSETWGSIVSPCTRTGATGLRPTFGRISRHGAMALSWTMDKLGPICRSVEDCALVLEAIHGPDGEDGTVVDLPFRWDAELDPRSLKVAYVPSHFEEQPLPEEATAEERETARATLENGRVTLDVLRRELGIELIPFELPDLPVDSLSFILSAEAAAAFDELTRSGRDDLLVRQERYAWPNVFRQARLIPAVEYIQANRVRALLMREMEQTVAGIDVYVTPPYGGSNLLLTNLTGHPAVVLPNGVKSNGAPTSVTFNGKLFGEAAILAVARAYQEATGFHRRHPPLFLA
jgi:Asp-tRNA(Asn)/Glu-tRNA(Gln) amidotransferase A subunit family amidase